MQRASASVVVETIRGVGLLLRLHYDGARPQRMHRAAGHVNHLALIDVDPIEQLFRAIFLDALRELSHGNAGLQAQGNLRSGLGMRHIPAFGFAPGLAEALRDCVVGMYLDRKLFLRKQKLQKQRKTLRIASGRAHQFRAEFLAEICQRPFRQRSVRDHAVVAGEPGFPDSFVEFVIGIDGGKIERAPRARVEGGRHQEWVELGHRNKL